MSLRNRDEPEGLTIEAGILPQVRACGKPRFLPMAGSAGEAPFQRRASYARIAKGAPFSA